MNTNTKKSLMAIPLVSLATPVLGAVSIDSSMNLATPSRPAGIASADFNGDGIADLAIATDLVDKVDVFLGTGGGAFGPSTPIFTGANTGPDTLRAVDIDGDGDTDLAVVLNNINTLRIYTNTGGVFSAGQSVALGAEARSLISADFDGNGSPDFATANRDSNSLSVVLNTGGVLGAASSVAVGGEPRGVGAGDFNSDGIMDLAASDRDSRTVKVFAGNGVGAFVLSATLPTNPLVRPDGVIAVDIDGDGDDDLASSVSDDVFNAVAIYTNNAGVLSAPAFAFVSGLNPSELAAADLDADGDEDIVVSNSDSNTVSVMENMGGIYTESDALVAGTRPGAQVLTDLDGNGSIDLAVTNRDSDSTTIWFTEGAGPLPCNSADLAEPFGTLDFSDVTAFLVAFSAMDPSADLAAPIGQFDFSDVVAFLGSFGAGCP